MLGAYSLGTVNWKSLQKLHIPILNQNNSPSAMEKKPFKLKTPSEIGKMMDDPNCTELVIYIDKLHAVIKDYQIIIDVAISKNQSVQS
jgi:hypothetical protein